MEKITASTFFDRTMSFRKKMGRNDLSTVQRRNLLKMYTLSYLNIDQTDPLFGSAGAAYVANSREWMTRMNMLGQDPFVGVDD